MTSQVPILNGHAQSVFDFLAPIEVELQGQMLDGKPPVVRMRPLTPLEWAAQGRSMPTSISKRSAEDMTPDEQEANYKFVSKIVACAITHFRSVQRGLGQPASDVPEVAAMAAPQPGLGDYEETWLSVKFVDEDPDRTKGQLTIEEFDRRDNVTRCWNALMDDLNAGGPLAGVEVGTEDGSFRS